MKFCLCMILIGALIEASFGSLQEDISKGIRNINRTAKSLSRKRRYLTFPEGSSLQLVYCLTLPSVGVGEIFTIGITAALAWELPSKPEEILLLKGKIKPTTEAPTTTTPSPPHHPVELEYDHHFDEQPSRRVDKPPGYPPVRWPHHNELFQEPVKSYYNPFVTGKSKVYGFNPVGITKSPVYERWKYESGESWKNKGQNTKHLDEYASNYANDIEPVYYDHPVYHFIHRRTRRDLYGKIEKLLSALSKDGKSCVMKALCEVSQVPEGKGTFIEEILKTIFRIKPHEGFPDEDDYDKAANAAHNCTEKYPTCEHSVWTNMF